MTRQVAASLLAAIFRQPDLKTLRQKSEQLRYRLREPPRQRAYQAMPTLS
jgi:hypothetical protein